MIYLPDELEKILKDVMTMIKMKRNSGVLEVNEYEVQNLNPEVFCGSINYNFDIVAIFEEKAISKLYSRTFQDALNQNFAVKNIQIQPIENNRTQATITCVQNI